MPFTYKTSVFAALTAVLPFAVGADPVALLSGSNDYRNLPNVQRGDRVAPAARALRNEGFDVTRLTNAGNAQFTTGLNALEAKARGADGIVVLLSGRFVHSATETYYLVTGATGGSLEAVRREGIAMSTLLAILAEHPGKAVLALGHGSEFQPRSPFLSGGTGEIDVPQGVTVLSGPSTSIVASVAALVSGEPVLDAGALSRDGISATGFLPSDGAIAFGDTAPLVAALPDPRDTEDGFWRAVRALNTVPAYEAYLNEYPSGIFATEARERITDLRDAPLRAAEATEAALNLNRDQRRNIQRALTLLDFNTRGIDGIFGRGTRGAITAFQRAQDFDATGYLTREQIRRLDRLARARAEELEAEAQREAERKAAEDRRYWRQTGASGREEDLRRYLDRYPNGIFAEDANAELRAIEEIRRPRVSAVEQATWQQVEQVGTSDAYREYLRRYPNGAFAETARENVQRLEREAQQGNDRQAAAQGEQRMNLSPSTRRTIEQRLASLDYDPGPVDGQFTRKTRNALLRYQRDRRLPATGFMNDPTMVRILADTVISIFD